MRPAANLLYQIVRVRRGGRKATTQDGDGRDRTGFETDGWLIKPGRCIQTLFDPVASSGNCVQSQRSERRFWLFGQANSVLQQSIRANNPTRTPLPDGKVVLLSANDRSNGADWGMARSQGGPCARVVFSSNAPVAMLGVLAHARCRLFTYF